MGGQFAKSTGDREGAGEKRGESHGGKTPGEGIP
jgi:hypothetical protein